MRARSTWRWWFGARAGRAAAALAWACCAGLSSAQVPGPVLTKGVGPAAASCTKECHQDVLRHKKLHGPVATDCGSCHVQVGERSAHTFTFVVPKDQLCVRCHNLPVQAGMHAPVRDGKCSECHDPHGTDRPGLLVADPQRELCAKCHREDFGKFKHVHGPVAVGACIVCHAPHSAPHPKLLTQDTRSMCLGCHDEIRGKIERGAHVHAAMDAGCTSCHDAHASAHPFQLRDTAPGLCLSCHKEQFERMTAGAKVIHGAVTAEGGCTTCHEPHASARPALQRGTERAACLTCHDKVVPAADGTRLTNMAAHLDASPHRHGPIREGTCTACHDPHAGQHFRLLSADYPAQFYAPFDVGAYQLCFKCHVPDLVLKQSGKGLTQFRDGDTNLHYLHVNREKGRTCRACHEVHASQRPSHVREAVPFGNSGWMLQINYERTDGGGKCAPGCHVPKTYTRGIGTGPPTSGLIGASP